MALRQVKVKYAPISDRYWHPGCTAQIDEEREMIRISGAWFKFHEAYEVEEFSKEKEKQSELITSVIYWYRNTNLNVDGYSPENLMEKYWETHNEK